MAYLTPKITNTAKKLTNILIPPICLMCQDKVETDHSLCPSCFGHLSFIVQPTTKQGIPLPFEWMIEEFKDEPSSCDLIRSALVYNTFSSDMIHKFKYEDHLEMAPFLSKLLFQAGRDILQECHALMPVPLHPWRMWHRRYNQTSVLAHALRRACSRESSLKVKGNVLARSFSHIRQVGLNRTERLKNIAHAFSIAPHAEDISGQTVLILDDVITTGATVEACAALLKKAGARRVYALSVLRVLNRMEGLPH